jgi:serine protease Do
VSPDRSRGDGFGVSVMAGWGKGSARLAWVIGTSILLGFLLGNLTDFSVRRLNLLSRSGTSVNPTSFADVADRVNESVVSVVSSKIIDLNQLHEGFEFWSPLKPEEDNKRKSVGYGSGFVVDRRGLVLTNEHVIDDSRHIIVRLFDGQEYAAELLGTDQETDLAVLRINPKNRLEPVRFGDSDHLRVGDWVMAVGNPYNYDHTVTVGIVSAKDRKIDDNPFERYIQTDAAINFGNSGGPLFNTKGEVVAINTAISTKGRGIGFAIPINLAKEIVAQIEERGRVVRGFLGLRPEPVTEDHVKVLNLPSAQGILVTAVDPDTAAEKAGIRRYDVITEIAGKLVMDKDDFFRRIAETRPGATIRLKGIRDQQPIEFEAIVQERPPLGQASLRPRELNPNSEPNLEPAVRNVGIVVQELTDEHRKAYRINNTLTGVVVVNVANLSPAAEAGLEPGDVILEINKHPVRSLVEYQKLVSHFKREDVVMLLVSLPKNDTRIFTLKLTE